MKLKNNKIKNKKILPFSSSRYNKENFEEFCKLEIDWNIKSIDKKDLPDELSDKTCEFIDLFRRMTVDEKIEWNFYIDYENNEIIHCLKGQKTNVKAKINSALMKTKKIITVHNHPLGTYSAPSATNFEILEHGFENYEIICAEKEYWILEAKGFYDSKFIEELKTKIENLFFKCDNAIYKNEERPYDANNEYSTRLPKYINNLKTNIKLIKMEYR